MKSDLDRRETSEHSILTQATAALRELSAEKGPPNTALSKLVAAEYATIVGLRANRWTWDKIAIRLQSAGVAFTAEGMRRAVARYELLHFGKQKTTGRAKRRLRARPLLNSSPTALPLKS